MPGMEISSSTAVRKGSRFASHLRVDLGNGDIDGIDLIEMQAQQEAMVLRDAAAQRLAEFFR